MPSWRELFPDLEKRTLVMGVLNVTPDSFSDGGRFQDFDAAVARGRELVHAGADIVDVGGESTRPGAPPVDAAEELARIEAVVRALAAEVPVSVDTTKAAVARGAVQAGARVINDISGGTFDPEILTAAAELDTPIVLMHTRAEPRVMQTGTWVYDGGVIAAVRTALEAQRDRALRSGVLSDRIVIDPGVGFGKTLTENLELLRNLRSFAHLGPVLVGTSRKSFLGKITGREVADREIATAASVALAIEYGASIVRVHDVAAMRDAVLVADAWSRSNLSH